MVLFSDSSLPHWQQQPPQPAPPPPPLFPPPQQVELGAFRKHCMLLPQVAGLTGPEAQCLSLGECTASQ